jgi:hypothetical protein
MRDAARARFRGRAPPSLASAAALAPVLAPPAPPLDGLPLPLASAS